MGQAGFPTPALWVSGARAFFVVGAALWAVGRAAASVLASAHQVHHPPPQTRQAPGSQPLPPVPRVGVGVAEMPLWKPRIEQGL